MARVKNVENRRVGAYERRLVDVKRYEGDITKRRKKPLTDSKAQAERLELLDDKLKKAKRDVDNLERILGVERKVAKKKQEEQEEDEG